MLLMRFLNCSEEWKACINPAWWHPTFWMISTLLLHVHLLIHSSSFQELVTMIFPVSSLLSTPRMSLDAF